MAHKKDLIRFLSYKLGSDAMANDFAHDVYLKIQALPCDETIKDPRALIFKAAKNLVFDHIRKEKRQSEIRESVNGIAWIDSDELEPIRYALSRAELEYIGRVIDQLDARCRRVFFLYRFEEKSQSEIAESLGIGITTVRKDINKAM
ncbi:MAG: RNA polymerase sigma factor, partial [Pseudomonadota bacterium]